MDKQLGRRPLSSHQKQALYFQARPQGARLAMAIILVFFACSQLAFAALPPQVQKLKRGISNVVLGGVEVPKYMIVEATNAKSEWKSSFLGVFYGPFKGAYKGALRILSGAYDVATFPINYPDNYSSFVSPNYFTLADID